MIQVEKTKLDGVLLIKPEVFHDYRGEYVETYNEGSIITEATVTHDRVFESGGLGKLIYHIEPREIILNKDCFLPPLLTLFTFEYNSLNFTASSLVYSLSPFFKKLTNFNNFNLISYNSLR